MNSSITTVRVLMLNLRCSPVATKVAKRLCAAATIWSTLVANVLAQGAVIQKEEEPKGYVPSYMIVIFGVGLGLLVICRTGKRTTSFRHDG